MSNNKLNPLKSVREYCEFYFDNYNKNNNYREAWLELKERRFKQIRDNNFYLDADAETFKNKVMKFWEGRSGAGGWNYRNSEIRKKGEKGKSGNWVYFQDANGETPNSEEIIENLKNNLELHGNYSWSMLFRGGDITVDMPKLKRTLKYLLDDNINGEEIFNRFNEVIYGNNGYTIKGLGHSKASMFLHIKHPEECGVWNSCVWDENKKENTTFKILSKVDSKFQITGIDNREKYKKINERLRWLLENYNYKKYKNDNYGFENLSDVDIFVWYISNNF